MRFANRHDSISHVFGVVLLASLATMAALAPADEPAATQVIDKIVNPQGVVLKDLEGNDCQPLVAEEGSYAIVVFITTDCPIANAYVPRLNKMREQFADQKVKWTLLHANPDLTTEAAKTHKSEYKLTHPVALDAQHVAVKATGATVTPEAFVIDSGGNILYRGLIDNQFSGYGDRKVDVTHNYLQDAISAAVAGKQPEVKTTKPLGCFIE